MNTDIANWCRYCTGCQAAKVVRHNKPVFGKFEEPTERFDHVHVDLVGPLPYSDGFKYLLTCVDRFTRWPEAIPIKDIRAETVADAFFGVWVARFGTPATITTDRAQFESRLWDTLCNQFGITRNRTTSYHPRSNSMVERRHRQLKAPIMAHETPNPWTATLPAVLLGIRSAVKETLGRSVAKMAYRMTLRLPGDFTENYTVDANTDLVNYSDRLRVAMSRLPLSPPRETNQKDTLQYKELDTCSHVFLQRIAIAPSLTTPYDGPYKVVARRGRVFKVLIKGKVETVTADRVKPAHIERTPKDEQTRQSTAMSKTTAIQPRAKIHEPQKAVVGIRSTASSTPSEAGVCTKQSLNRRSTVKTKATAPEVSRRGEKPGKQSNTKATLYKAPHVRNATTSRANGRYDGIEHIHEFLCI